MKKLEEVYPDFLTNGAIFSDLAELTGIELPWEADSETLDVLYMTRSGKKWAGALIDVYLDENGELDSSARSTIAFSVYVLLKDAWDRLALAWEKEYDPLENYNEIGSKENTGTQDNDRTYKPNEQITNDHGVFGFNSAEASPAETNTETRTALGSGTTDNVKRTDNLTEETTRHGNIGVTTSQQMLESELNFRKNYQFYQQIFELVDSAICLKVY